MQKPGRKRKRFGEILVEARVVDEHTLNRALEKQRGTGRRLGQVLEEMGVVTEKVIAAALARQFGFKTVSNIAKASFSHDLLKITDSDTAMNKMIFPLKKEGGSLFLAMVNPLDIETIDNLSFRIGLRIVPCVTTPTEIQAAVNKHYLHIIQEVELADYDSHAVIEFGQGSHSQAGKKPVDKWYILIVDDQAEELSRLKAVLQKEEFVLLEAPSGGDGLEVALKEHPHLILANTEMQRMDGIELLRAFKTIQMNLKSKRIPMIAISSKPGVEEEAKFLDMGYCDFILKPINPARIVARVNNALRNIYGSSPPSR